MKTKYNNYLVLKAFIKAAALSQRSNKQLFKKSQREADWTSGGPREDTLARAKSQLRLHHVAYCLARGRTIDQIEGTAISPISVPQLTEVMVAYFGYLAAAELLTKAGLLDAEKSGALAAQEGASPTVWGQLTVTKAAPTARASGGRG